MELNKDPGPPIGNSCDWQSQFRDLPLMLSYKSSIKPAFKEYTSSLAYDLSVYQGLFDQFDAQAAAAPAEQQDALWDLMLKAEGRRFIDFFNLTMVDLSRLASGLSETEYQQHGYYFRRQFWNVILQTPFLLHSNRKPRGYPGDFEMMKMIYRNGYEGRTTFGRLMHKICSELPASQSVRNRKQMLVDFINNYRHRNGHPPGRAVRLLSIACGPAFELRDLLACPDDCERFEITLLDQDEKALDEAAAVSSEVAVKLKAAPKVSFLNASVRTMLLSRHLVQKWGQFDFIYALGLFDYLNQPVARALLKRLVQLLNPGGEMLIGNYHVENISKTPMAYWADWMLLYRTEEEFRSLVADQTDTDVRLLFEPTGCQMFLHIKRA